MPSRKRSIEAVDGDAEAAGPQLLHRIRNMWQFANLCQWIYMFGKVAKIDESIDIEQIETECLKPSSDMLVDIALALLKLVSSHRGLTYDILDDQARKQYLIRAPDRNPFGDGDEPQRFTDFDILIKIQVLQQMTQWAMIHPERVRDKMEEQRDIEQANWRIEPYGWDGDDRTYYVLDDNRVYRLTEAQTPPPSRPKKSKSSRSSRRSSKRRRTAVLTSDEQDDPADEEAEQTKEIDNSLGGMTWECVAITLDDVRRLVDGLRKSRDDNEKVLRKQLEDHLVPILEKQEESRKRKELQRDRELLNLAKMANAKRSSRIADKAEQQKRDQEEKEEERLHREAVATSRREEQMRLKMEKDRDSRLVSREKRLQDREARRVQHEEELANLSEDSKNLESGKGRLSERRLQVEIERNRQALLDLEQEEEDWVFDCICGLHGHIDDGTHSVACERCNVWYHSKCLGISEEEADRPEFQFICTSCIHQEEQAKARPRPTIKLKLNRPLDTEPPSDAGSLASKPTQSTPLVTDVAANDSLLPPYSTTQGAMQDDAVAQNLEQVQPKFSEGALALPHHHAPPAAEGFDAGQPVRVGTAQHGTPNTTNPPEVLHAMRASPNFGPTRPAGDESTDVTNEVPSDEVNSQAAIPATTPVGFKQLHASNQAVDASLSSPHISRDIYRAVHIQNGALPAKAGHSPTKHSPQQPDSTERNKTSGTGAILPPIALLSPSHRDPILTPPTKPSDPLRPNGSR